MQGEYDVVVGCVEHVWMLNAMSISMEMKQFLLEMIIEYKNDFLSNVPGRIIVLRTRSCNASMPS